MLFGISIIVILAVILGAYFALGEYQGSEPRIVESAGTSEEVMDTETAPKTTTTVTSVAAGEVTVTAEAIPEPRGSLAGVIVCIDPGHANTTDAGMEPIGPGATELKVKDPGGTSGIYSGIREPVVTLAISLRLRDLLQAEGATVVMTREGGSYNGGNRDRAAVANHAGADLFIRIHADGSTDSSRNGASTLYPSSIAGWTDDIYAESLLAAQAIQGAMVSSLAVNDNGVVARSDICGFNWADVPAILAEVGFLTNPDEDEKLNTPGYQQQVAQALLSGIKNYFS